MKELRRPMLCIGLLAGCLLSGSAMALNEIKTFAPIAKAPGTWMAADPVIGAWGNVGEPSGCSNWAPATSTVTGGTTFTQTATDCQQEQQRTSQAREQNDVTLKYRNVGTPTMESRSIASTQTRSATGTAAATNLPRSEDQGFYLGQTTVVRFGYGTRYVQKTFAAGNHTCSRAQFGSDPAQGAVKSCWIP